MKAFFQHVSDVEEILEPEPGKPASMSLEELYLPKSIYEDVSSALSQSNDMLPASARNFREWKVGFLNRLDRKHTWFDLPEENIYITELVWVQWDGMYVYDAILWLQ